MKHINPLENFIDQSVKTHFELCLLADEVYKMGANSGPKRTILLYLNQRGEASVAELSNEYPDPKNLAKWSEILVEMIVGGLVSREFRRSEAILTLTDAGKSKSIEIIKFESSLVDKLGPDLSISDLRKATTIMRQVSESLDEYRLSRSSSEAREVKLGRAS